MKINILLWWNLLQLVNKVSFINIFIVQYGSSLQSIIWYACYVEHRNTVSCFYCGIKFLPLFHHFISVYMLVHPSKSHEFCPFSNHITPIFEKNNLMAEFTNQHRVKSFMKKKHHQHNTHNATILKMPFFLAYSVIAEKV